eukprot:gene12177-16242_t
MLVFGSAATNSMTAESDVDFLYEFDTTGLDFNNLKDAPYDYSDNFFGLKSELETILNRKVDLIENKPFKNPYFRQSVERSQKMIYELCKQHHVKELYAFGSVVRDDFNAESDVDFIVFYFKDTQGLPTGNFDYFNLLFALENLTGKKVDLVSEDAINNRYFKERIDSEKMQLYKAAFF